MSELTDFEKKLDELVKSYSYCSGEHQFPNHYSYYEDLRKIMPPTCTENERKFLDKLKEAKSLMMTVITAEGIESYDVDFKKMIEGEDE
jgi:hypothetical protein